MNTYVVAISIDKVQSFLYHVLQSPTQDSQSNSGTLSSIIHSSNKISKDFYKDIGFRDGRRGPFFSHIEEELMVCSGMCIFTTNLSEEVLLEKLDALFKQYYLDNAGRLLLKYVYFENDIKSNEDRLCVIQESKHRLRQKECLNTIIERNQELLFQFHQLPQKESSEHKSVADDLSKTYGAFAETINLLYDEESADNDNRFRIAVIKADLDGMGDLFKSIKNYNAYIAVSKLLSCVINLKSLHEITKKEQKRNEEFKLYPLYLAGDDIFFAVPVSQLIRGVNICKAILLQLNKEIAIINEQFNLSLPKLSISVGVDFTYNREPIRYYYERVQQQVDGAKQNKLEGAMKVCISNYVFYDIYKDENVDEKAIETLSNWHHFISEAKVLKGAIDEGFVAHHFFYSLLNKITDPQIYMDEIKYSNAVLYHLIPRHLEGNNKKLREFELMLLQKLMSHLFVKNRKGQHEIRITNDTRKQLETYIRLLLLFSDGRFQLIEKPKLEKNFNSEQVKRALFNKPLRYMYQHSLHRSLIERVDSEEKIKEFRKVFVKHEKYKSQRRDKVEVYRTLKISSSMFHRLKNTDKFDVLKAADMIQAVNLISKDEVKELEKQRKKEKKAPPGLYFDIEKFKSIANHTSLWNQDYMDTLLIFYQLKELSIRFRMIYPQNKNNKSNNSYKGKDKSKGTNKKNNKRKGARK